MAIFNSIALGNSKKSIGNVTTLKLKGQNIAKAKIVATTNRKSAGQVSQRNQMTNAVKSWPYIKSFFELLKSQVKSTESRYNAWVRLFINALIDTVPTSISDILASIANGNYGNGTVLDIVSAVKGATGLTITFKPDHTIFPAGSQIIACMFVQSSGSFNQEVQVITGDDSQTILIPYAALTDETLSFIAAYAADELDTMSSAIAVATTLQA